MFIKTIEAEWHIYSSIKHTIIGSDNGLSNVRHQSIIWNSDGILLMEPLGTNFSEILLTKLKHFHWRICIWKCRLSNWWPSCPGLNSLTCSDRGQGKVSQIILLTTYPLGLSMDNTCRFHISTLRPRQSRYQFPDDNFKCIFLKENI